MIWRRLTVRRTGALACRQFVEAVTDYLEGAMPARDRARFEHHLSQCDGCDRYLAPILRTVAITPMIPPMSTDPFARSATASSPERPTSPHCMWNMDCVDLRSSPLGRFSLIVLPTSHFLLYLSARWCPRRSANRS